MRVLWLSPSEMPAIKAMRGGNADGGRWIENLRVALCSQTQIELGIACVTSEPFDPFIRDGVTYFPLVNRMSRTRLGRGVISALQRSRSLNYVPQCMNAIKDYRPDLVHVHGTETTLGLVAGRASVPVIVSLQGLVREIVPRYLEGASRLELLVDCSHVIRLLRGTNLTAGYLRLRNCRSAELRTVRSARFFTGRTVFDREYVKRINPGSMYYHCDRILRPEFYSDYIEPDPDGPTIYCTAGAAPYKGVDILLDAVAELVSSGMADIRVRVAGGIEGTTMGTMLENRVRRLGLQQNLIWLGALSPGQIMEELRVCAVSVTPSRIENSPNSLAEAMIRGAACVASDAGGIRSMVQPEEEGLLFRSGDSHSLALQLKRVLADSELRKRLGDSARARAILRHDASAIVDATLSCYRSILGL